MSSPFFFIISICMLSASWFRSKTQTKQYHAPKMKKTNVQPLFHIVVESEQQKEDTTNTIRNKEIEESFIILV